MIGRLPPQLLGDLEGERLGALGVVRAHVDVDEGPTRTLARQFGTEPVDVVVGALHSDHGPPVNRGHGHLGPLQVVRDQHHRIHAGPGRMGGHRVGEVAGGGAGGHLEARAGGPWSAPPTPPGP